MSHRDSHLPVSGAAMDEKVPRQRSRLPLIGAALAIVAMAGVVAANIWLPGGYAVSSKDVHIAAVMAGVYNDQMIVRATATPAVSVMLDAIESGRVEEIRVKDGVTVKQGDLLFRLSNPQRRLDVLARQSDYAQQFSNYSNMRVQYEMSRNDYRRRLDDLNAEIIQIRRQHERNVQLSAKGFISRASLEQSQDSLNSANRKLMDEEAGQREELAIKQAALDHMAKSLAGLDDVSARVEF